MHPIKFKGSNVVFAEDQPEYLPLPAFKDSEGQVVTCWKLTFKERLQVLFYGRFYFLTLTFNHPLQPQKPSVKTPLVHTK